VFSKKWCWTFWQFKDKIYVLLLHMLKYFLIKYDGHQYCQYRKRHDFFPNLQHCISIQYNLTIILNIRRHSKHAFVGLINISGKMLNMESHCIEIEAPPICIVTYIVCDSSVLLQPYVLPCPFVWICIMPLLLHRYLLLCLHSHDQFRIFIRMTCRVNLSNYYNKGEMACFLDRIWQLYVILIIFCISR
jgi:hypothetical protein